MTCGSRWIVSLSCVVWALVACVVASEEGGASTNNSTTADATGHAEIEPAVAVLFPWFALCLGTFAFITITRFLPWVPYTALMFIIGTITGIAVVRLDRTTLLTESVSNFWLNIDHEVLLLVFLPGLIAKDAIQLDAGLFRAAFWQCLVFAFPMVLAGTVLTALVCYYIFPYGWSFYFAMTLGSILAATDPVAVASLMSEVGAPPRLQIHVSGESLLNDGSAIVFFTIFSEMFLAEMGVPGLGSDIDFAQGVAIFFQMSLGAVASGLMFGIGTRGILYLLKRRLNREENVVEVATTFTMAYLGYFVTEQVFHCSGVIGTLTYGIIINLSSSLINDHKLMEDFWALVEYLLNTVLFTLGGLVWGEIIANDNSNEQFSGNDWGYLFVLYFFLMVIRFFLMFATYPITASIGLGTNIPETFFSAYAGLRGAVGIALALFIDNVVDLQGIPEYQQEANRLFGFVGGIAFLTLIVNATTAGPLLRKLGLADKTEIRKKVIDVMHWRIRQRLVDDMVTLLSEPRFHRVNFAVVRDHIPMIQDMTMVELQQSVKRFKTPKRKFLKEGSVPFLGNLTPYLKMDGESDGGDVAEINQLLHGLAEQVTSDQIQYQRPPPRHTTTCAVDVSVHNAEEALDTVECRRLFLEILLASYALQVETGDLTDREILVRALYQSLEFAKSDVCKGLPLDDWQHSDMVRHMYPIMVTAVKYFSRFLNSKSKQALERKEMQYDVDRCMAYLEAHRRSREVFKHEFVSDKENMTEAELVVLKESEATCAAAIKLLESYPAQVVETMISYRFCIILLNTVVRHFEEAAECGVLTSKEAEDFLAEIQDLILRIDSSRLDDYPKDPASENKPDKDGLAEGCQ